MQQLPVNRSGWTIGRKSMRHSVIRRSLYVSLFYVAGHAFYYLLILVANSRLEPADFGRFYLGWAILNIVAAPGAVLTLALSGHFAEVHRVHGAGQSRFGVARHAYNTVSMAARDHGGGGNHAALQRQGTRIGRGHHGRAIAAHGLVFGVGRRRCVRCSKGRCNLSGSAQVGCFGASANSLSERFYCC